MPPSLRILLVESDPERAERVREALAEAGERDVSVISGRRVLARAWSTSLDAEGVMGD